MTLNLPDFPWDSLVPYGDRARAHPGGIVDLSVGSPVDATPTAVQAALASASDAAGYPATVGTLALRDAIVDWYQRRRRTAALGVANVMPTIGSKELITLLPLMLGLGRGDTVVYPRVAYPSYAVGAAIAGADGLASDDPEDWPASTRLIWLNSPGNPDGTVRTVDELRAAVARARQLGAVIASDECYAELNWAGDEPTPSILDERVIGSDRRDVLSVYSLSKQSNMAGYRAGIVAGCATVIGRIVAVRKHLGLIPPAPVQAAMIAALADEGHVAVQRQVYRARRAALITAVEARGLRIDGSEAGLYLWATDGRDCWEVVDEFADLGVLVTPGSFYGAESGRHVRIALTATDRAVAEAVVRLAL